jgi:hypothetical protein
VINTCTDTGTPNAVIITPNPAVSSYWLGQYWRIKVANLNTAAATINVNGLGAVALVHADLTPLTSWELFVGQMIDVVYDGAGHFQLLSGGPSSTQPVLTAARSVYVNPVTGNDTTLDGSQATVSGAHGPFQTLQKALATMTKYNLGGWSFNIYLADGNYTTTSVIRAPLPNGSGTVFIVGNHASPQNVVIYNTNQGSALFVEYGGNYYIDGVSYRTTAPMAGDPGHGLWAAGGSTLSVYASAFYYCAGLHIAIQDGSVLFMVGPVTLYGGIGTSHIGVFTNGIYGNYQIAPGPPLMTFAVAGLNWPQGFVQCTGGGYAQVIYSGFTGFSTSGYRYSVASNGVIETGARGINYLPGDTAGLVASGGQYT